jgi:hypothetical protein
MVEYKNGFPVKVDTLKNIANASTKSIGIEKFSWCREAMGIATLNR